MKIDLMALIDRLNQLEKKITFDETMLAIIQDSIKHVKQSLGILSIELPPECGKNAGDSR